MAEPGLPAIQLVTPPGSETQYASVDGKVWLTKGGKFFSADPNRLDSVYGDLGDGTRPATAAEVEGRLREKHQDTLGGKARNIAENVGIGAMSAAALPPRVIATGLNAVGLASDETVKQYTGESFAKDISGAYALATGSYKDIDKAQKSWVEDYRARERNNPTLAAVSKAAGEIGEIVATGGISAAPELIAGRSLPQAALRVGAAAGVENALLSTGQETGRAVIENRDIDRERLAADGLTAAMLGAVLGGGGVIAGRGAKFIKNKVFGGATLDGAGEAARSAERAAGAPNTLQEALLETRGKASEAVEAAGVNPVARDAAATLEGTRAAEGAANADPSNWKKLVKDANPLELYAHRESVLADATRDAADDLNKVLEHQKPIYDRIDNFAAKREKVAAHLEADAVDETALLQRVQDDSSAIRSRLDATREELAAQRAENVSVPEAASKIKANGADTALNRAEFIVKRAEKTLAKVESGADGVIAVDQMRRELAKLAKSTKRALGQTQGLEERLALEPVAEFLHKEYLTAADSLMDANVVGARQAAAQSAVNRARVGSIASGKHDLGNFLVRVADDSATDYGRVAFRANQDSIRSLLSEIQPGAASRVKTEQFERFLDAEIQTQKAIREGYAASPAELKQLEESLASLENLRGTLNSARDAAGKVNEAHALFDNNKIGVGRVIGTLAGGLSGGVEGGVGGALRGAARGALIGGNESVVALRQRMAALAESHDSRIAGSMTGWIDKLISKGGTGAPAIVGGKGGKKLLSDGARRAFANAIPEEKTMMGGALSASPTLRRFLSGTAETRAEQRELLQERRQQLADIITNPAKIQHAAETVLGNSAQHMPGMAADMVAETLSRLTKLHEKLGGSSQPSLLPNVKKPEMVSDQELRAQHALVQATVDPMSIFRDFANGTPDPVKVEFVQQLYPQIWQQAQAASMDRLMQLEEAPPISALTKIDTFMQLHGALDPSLKPDFLARQAGRAKLAAEQDKPKGGGRPPQVAKGFATMSQRIATGNS